MTARILPQLQRMPITTEPAVLPVRLFCIPMRGEGRGGIPKYCRT